MQKKLLSLIIMANLLLLSACQPPSDKTDTSNTAASSQAVKNTTTQALVEAKTAKELTSSIIELSEGKLRDQLICTKLSDTMQAIDNKSRIEDIHAVQRQVKACLPSALNTEVLTWLNQYQAMYNRFLGTDLYMDDEAFYDIVETLEQGKKASVAQLKQLRPRVRYLVGLAESKADVSILYVGEGIFVFHHDLQQMADIFTPYLPKDQQAFIERMAKDNQDIFWNDAAIAVPFDEVIARAQFWQDYIQRYPESHFIKDAKFLLTLYRHALFFGSNNTQWTNDEVTKFIEPKYQQAIEKLAKGSNSILANSILAKDARTLLEFMAMPNSKRHQAYPVPKVDDEGYETSDWAVPRYQLNQALPIPSPWDNNKSRDCLSGIVCVDYDY
ncbi:hypothetical protein M0N77_10305 [Psychrobacter sp. AH5]|uniref:hypothetical protein n=1 Tax=Psychrobacter sp. AH5 TaxID=2937433 RepID=UPI003342AD09